MQRGGWSKRSRHSRLESVPSSVLKRFRSNFEVGRRGIEEERERRREGGRGRARSSAFENITEVKRPVLIKLRYDVCARSFRGKFLEIF